MTNPSNRPVDPEEQPSFTPPWMRKVAESTKAANSPEIAVPMPSDDPEGKAVPARKSPDDVLVIDDIRLPSSLDPTKMADFVGFPQPAPKWPVIVRLMLAIILAVGVAAVVITRTSSVSVVLTQNSAGLDVPTNAPELGSSVPVKYPHLSVMQPDRSAETDEAYQLRVSTVALDGEEATLLVDGLASGSKLSAGRPSGPNSWLLGAADLGHVTILPPRGFAGSMNLMLELRLSNGTIADRKALEVTWSARASTARETPVRRLSPEDIATLMKLGNDALARGEVASARLAFRRAAESGNAEAAFALGETYEASALNKLGARGVSPDIAQARSWYQKARELGSTDAQKRLNVLAGVTR